ncbi:MAG: hypothetical protein ACRD0P_19275 [Stackebrandtia sp.]
MPETTGDSRDEHKHGGLMAGLEIVDAEDEAAAAAKAEVEAEAPLATVPEPESDPLPALPPIPDPTVEHALAPIQKMWDVTETRCVPPAPSAPHKTPVEKPPRRLFLALPGLLVLAIVAAFASWVTAAPLWLAMGSGIEGTMTVKTCDASGCHGVFRPDADDRSIAGVRVTGATEAKRAGESHRARVTSRDATTAYAGDSGGLWWRIGIGTAVLVGCGFAVAAITGAWRWHGRARLLAVVTSLAAPLGLFVAVLAVSW